MLFNSYAFIFVFLPIALVGFEIAGRFHRRAVVGWLGFMSLAFYAYWKPVMLLVLLVSIAVNFTASHLIGRNAARPERAKRVLWMAIVLNLCALCYFKYLFPMLNFAMQIAHRPHGWENVLLPLGISFFTFTQIAYLVDLEQGIATVQDLPSYVLFVTFFPHLIAGPILHHKEMMPQFNRDAYKLRANDLAVGGTWFVLGLAKKTLLADVFALTAKPIFANNAPQSAVMVWIGVLSYAFQLYFDFSGYSDMALGLARMFSINFPLNFSSPYKARNIIDFWERWHITLTRYINAYLFSPFQFAISNYRQSRGKKVSKKAQATLEGYFQMVAGPILLTMLIAGIWHGAGLQFVVFGLLHGLYIASVHGWRILVTRHKLPQATSAMAKRLSYAVCVLITFFCVVVADIFFRSSGIRQASRMLGEMFGRDGLGWHQAMTPALKPGTVESLVWIVLGFFIVWSMPNTQQILAHFKPSLALTAWDEAKPARRLLWLPTQVWAVIIGVVFFASIVRIQSPSTFLYFQF